MVKQIHYKREEGDVDYRYFDNYVNEEAMYVSNKTKK